MAVAAPPARYAGPPPANPIVHTLRLTRFMSNPIVRMPQHVAAHGHLSAITHAAPVGRRANLLAVGPMYNQALLSDLDTYHNIGLPTFGDPKLAWLNHGLVFLNGPKHRQQRRMMMPMFHKRAVEHYRDIMLRHAERIMAPWTPGAVVDVHHAMHDLSMDITLEALLGLQPEDGEEARTVVKRWLRLLVNPFVHTLPVVLPGTPTYALKKASLEQYAIVAGLVARRRAKQDDTAQDLVTMLVEARDEDGTAMTVDEIVGQANLLFLAGYETSALAMSWAMVFLSLHPHVLADVLDELDALLGGRTPVVDDLPNMPLLDRVVKESMRLAPPVMYNRRLAMDDADLAGTPVAKGSTIMYSQYLTHRMPELYPQPDRFRPQRWENLIPGAYEYLPFSSGPRLCIGASFANMEMRLVLATMLQRWRFEPVGEVNHRGFGLLSMDHFHARLHPQDRAFTRAEVGGTLRDMVTVE